MIRIDLHSHSFASPDGGISINEYEKLIKLDKLDYIAVTDHDTIQGALKIKESLDINISERIIIGQEITTSQGEIIGLFLKKRVTPHKSAQDTVREIKQQGGLVYIPHPFETVRKGVTKITLDSIKEFVDIVEVFNGRAVFQNKGPQATTWARLNSKPVCASSDAHGYKGASYCYSIINEKPNVDNLAELLIKPKLVTNHAPLYTLLYPKLNRLRGKLSLRN